MPGDVLLTSSRAVYERANGRLAARYTALRPYARAVGAGQWDPSPLPEPRDGRSECGRKNAPEPTSVYGATKLMQEYICRSWTAGMGNALSVLRLQNVYGVGQSLDNPYTGVLSLFTKRALSGEVLPVDEDGNIVRDFVYIEDVVAAVVAPSPARVRAAGRFPPGRRGLWYAFDHRRGGARSLNWLEPRSPK